MRDYLTELLDRAQALTGMGDAVQGGTISAMSSHVDDRKGNERRIRAPKSRASQRSSVLRNLEKERQELITAGADRADPYLQR